MMKCEFIKDSNEVIVRENDEKILELSIYVNDDKVWVDVEHISESKSLELSKDNNYMGNYFMFINDVLKVVKEELIADGIQANKVLLGSFADVRKIDQFSCEIDEEYNEKEKTLKVSTAR